MLSIEDNVRHVKELIEKAASRSGRSGGDIRLVAASKQNNADAVRSAYHAGIDCFGENRVQELMEKKALGAYDGAELHLIGHLQKNKVKNVVGQCDLIQSVDSKELMELISKRATSLEIVQDILIEVNIGREETKTGIDPSALDDIASYASSLPGIIVKGLMAIPPINSYESHEKYNYFDLMYKLYVDIRAKKYDNNDICTLSMGMSSDFEEAIIAGSNMVRVGTAIFGPRAY